MKEKRNKKELLAVGLLVFSLVLITIGATFAFFTYSRQGTTENKIQTGNLTFIYDESKSSEGGVSLTNAFPMSDTDGEALTSDQSGVFDFDVRAKTEGAAIHYEIYLTKVAPQEEGKELPEKVVKTYLTTLDEAGEDQEENELNTEGLPTETNLNLYSALWDSKVPSILGQTEINAKTLYRETIESGQDNYQKHFRYRMWIAGNATEVNENGEWIYNNMSFSVKVNVYAQNEEIEEPTEPKGPHEIPSYTDTSNASAPELVTGMIPVVYDEELNSWVKQDVDKSYDYATQHWANAVTVSSNEKRQSYMNAKAGEKIDEEDINTMWVWIPRYEYKYTEMSQNQEIGINFISTDVTVSTDQDNYKVHPAFTFGEEQLEGFWYGKFETSSKESCSPSYGSIGNGCDIETYTPQIKPGVTSWRGIRVSTAFMVSQNIAKNTTEYGFDGNGIDTHMSKNSEWGAVTYLSQSAYGKYHVDQQEVYINNCSSYTTGIGGDTPYASENTGECTNTYATAAGQKASTTGNITGVYDMSGGSGECVMGALTDGSNKPRSGYSTSLNSGFNGVANHGGSVNGQRDLPDAKYYDLYTSTTSAKACDGGLCYGHALSETAGWYGNPQDFVSSSNPWFTRGGACYTGARTGVFVASYLGGNAYEDVSFRLVLVNTGA